MYAIVDIEATGTPAENNAIIEIAIVLHDGTKVEKRYNTLINPQMKIPYFVSKLTRISNTMVATAPLFKDVAPEIFAHLQGRIFVAHNVNFDLSFLQYHLKQVGFDWAPKKICTFKLSRKVFPGLTKYGLEHLTQILDIQLENSHRATDDAEATTILFEKILKEGGEDLIRKALKEKDPVRTSRSFAPRQLTQSLSNKPGVFYILNATGNVLFISKAKELRKVAKDYLAEFNSKSKWAKLVKQTKFVRFKESATYFTASLLEAIEIEQLQPEFNISPPHGKDLLPYGLYTFQDNSGYQRLIIDKKRISGSPLGLFPKLSDGLSALHKLSRDFNIHPVLCSLKEEEKNSINITHEEHNAKMQKAVDWLQQKLGTFIIKERTADVINCVLVENGVIYGIGIVNDDIQTLNLQALKSSLMQVPNNETIATLIRNYSQKYPENLKSVPE